MRRCKDDWVNATQILKLCNFPKAKRTKILEKGVQQGRHEKVQGGYGRFQGTWIPFPDAQKLAAEYGITSEMVPVLYIDLSDSNLIIPKKSKPPVASSQKDGTPVKRKYVKKAKKENTTPKKLKLDDDLPPQAVFTQDYPASLSRNSSHMSNQAPMQHLLHVPQQQTMQHLPPTFQQLEFMANGMNRNLQQMTGFAQNFSNYPVQVPAFQQGQLPQIREKPTTKFGTFPGGMEGITHQQLMYQQHQKGALSQSTNETNWSQEEHNRDSDTSMSSVDGKHGKLTMEDDISHAAQLLRFFSEDNAPIPFFLYNPPSDFNINEAIDDEGHTTLHWAASIGNLSLIHLVLSKGANPLVVSNYGLNPLSKCVSFNNCHDLRNFPQILDALEMCLINTDINGRTPLHYLCQFSKVKSKLGALTYYLEIVFNKLTLMSNSNGGTGVDLLKNVLDHQDVNGDSCLHLAARAGCTHFIKYLLRNGARDDLLNVNNETAKSTIMQLDLVVYNLEPQNGQVAQLQPYFQQPQSLEIAQQAAETRKREHQQGLGTPIQTANSRRAETPDTQRTTIQDDDEEEFNDRVSKEHLRILMEEQAGTVDENKENIFVEETPKINYDAMSTPKHMVASPQNGARHGVLGVISERTGENSPSLKAVTASPGRPYVPHPPKLDDQGHILDEDAEDVDPCIKLPMDDVSSMMRGMINLLSDSYTQEISGLKKERKRVKSILIEKKDQDDKCIEMVKVLLNKNGFKEIRTFEEAREVVDQELENFDQELRAKESHLLCSLEKAQAFELANLVHANESDISSPLEIERDDTEERLQIAIELTKAQLKRNELVAKVTQSVKSSAINSKMNKYRKLISLSCGLRVEDIDGLIDGIEESLMEGTL